MKTAIITTNPETERLCIIANRMARYMRRYGRRSTSGLCDALKVSADDVSEAFRVAGRPYGINRRIIKTSYVYFIDGPSEVG